VAGKLNEMSNTEINKETLEQEFMRLFTYEAGDGFRMNTSPRIPPKVLLWVTSKMEDYRKQGRFFTEDEICKIQSTAYDEGYSAGLDEAGC
jgi:hypothetical protein